MASKKATAPTVTVKRWFHTGGTTKAGQPTNTAAFADVVFATQFGPLVVTGVRIMKRKDGTGHFASFKQRKGTGDKWWGEQYLVEEGARDAFNTEMLKAYKAELKRIADEASA